MKNVLRIVLFIVVLLGLLWTVQKAKTQWGLAANKNRLQVLELRSQFDQPMLDSGQRQRLILQFDKKIASAPRLQNVRWRRIGLAMVLYAMALVPNGIVLGLFASALTAESNQSFAFRPLKMSTAVAGASSRSCWKICAGKALVVVLRVAALGRVGVPTSAATIAVFVETLMMMSVGAGLSAVVLYWTAVPRWMAISGILLGAVAAIPTIPPVLVRIVSLVVKQPIAQMRSAIDFPLTVRCWVLSSGRLAADRCQRHDGRDRYARGRQRELADILRPGHRGYRVGGRHRFHFAAARWSRGS